MGLFQQLKYRPVASVAVNLFFSILLVPYMGMAGCLVSTTIAALTVNLIVDPLIIYKHALKNALIPVITTIGLQVRVIFGGSLMIEQVFNIAGIGSLITTAIQGRDYMVVQGCVLIISVFVVIVNLVIDLLYGFVDPRIRKSWR